MLDHFPSIVVMHILSKRLCPGTWARQEALSKIRAPTATSLGTLDQPLDGSKPENSVHAYWTGAALLCLRAEMGRSIELYQKALSWSQNGCRVWGLQTFEDTQIASASRFK